MTSKHFFVERNAPLSETTWCATMRLLLFFGFLSYVFATGPCTCNPETVWLDVMIIFDSTTATTYKGLQEMLGYVQTAFSFVNVQNSNCTEKFHTRVGIIYYARTATLLYELGEIDGEQLEDITAIPYANEKYTNIEAAIHLANIQFNSTSHRQNARKVIFLLATTYNSGNYDAPQQIASDFKEGGGIIVIYNYEQTHGIATPTLEEIASPGFFIANYLDKNGDMARKALCDSNCFCPSGLFPFTTDAVTGVPTSGCYYAVNIGTGEQYAERQCDTYGGQLAKADSKVKTEFLAGQFLSNSNFWTSLRWNSTVDEYQWLDGSWLQPNSSYQPWYTGSGRGDGMDCVGTQRKSLEWVPMDCRNSLLYACENKACDSTNYCTQRT